MGGLYFAFTSKLRARPLEMIKVISAAAPSGVQVPGGSLPFSFLEFQVTAPSTSSVEKAENSRHSVLSAKAWNLKHEGCSVLGTMPVNAPVDLLSLVLQILVLFVLFSRDWVSLRCPEILGSSNPPASISQVAVTKVYSATPNCKPF